MFISRDQENCLFRSLLLLVGYFATLGHADIEYNTINDDDSYSFRHTNDDIGSYYHSASASPDNIVRGRYGSRNPATGQVEETVYTAGPRGFRANGPKIHRKMDLAQYPPRPIGTPDDPLADPYDDPSYSFQYRTADSSRSEDADATGRVRGLYSYIDDVGERHSVRYAAGAGTGFEVSNAVPDNPISVGYSSPLYKAHPKTRGKMSVQRGPNGSYKLIATGPDHRRAESRSPDGLVRGTYSYLDDKGVQRTVEYIAGAGIGYRVLQNSVGPGTHVNPSVSDFRLSDTDFRLSNEYGRGASGGGAAISPSGSGLSGNRRTGSAGSRGGSGSGGGSRGGEYSGASSDTAGNRKTNRNDANEDDDYRGVDGGLDGGSSRGTSVGSSSGSRNTVKTDRTGTSFDGSRAGGNKLGNRGGSRPSSNRNTVVTDDDRPRGRTRERDRNRTTASSGAGRGDSVPPASTSTSRHGGGYSYDPPSSPNNYNFNDDDVGSLPPLITANRKILEIDRERDWVERHRDSTVIKNVGKWYIGLPPGQSVRAHVQNIDLVPLGGRRVPSPSEALRQDEIAEMVASLEHGSSYIN